MIQRYVILAVLALAVASSGCVTRHTVKKGDEVIEQNYELRRPVKEMIRNSDH